MVSNVFSTLRHYGNYGTNFLLGTGSMTMGKEIGDSIKNRKANNMSFVKSLRTGFVDGFVKSNQEVKQAGGFWKNLGTIFKNMPGNMAEGWKSGQGKNGFTKFLSSLGKSLKPLGKLMPFAMNAIWLAQSIPDIVSRTKEEGIFGGIKETGKAIANIGVISLAAAVGASFGFVGMLGLPLVAGMAFNTIMGDPYRTKKAAEEEAKKQQIQQQNPFVEQPIIGQNLDIMSEI